MQILERIFVKKYLIVFDFNRRNRHQMVIAKVTRGIGYTRIETEAGGAARRIGPNDIRDKRRRDGREDEWARRRVMAKGRQASGNPPTPRAPDKSGQSDCPTIEERETSRYHAKQETD